MKTSISIFLICLYAAYGFCQGSVSITRNGCSNACFYNLEPSYDYTFNSNVTPPSGYSVSTYNWSESIGYVVTNPTPIFTNNICTLSFQNIQNYSGGLPTHNVKLKVKFVSNSNPSLFQEITSSNPVEVRYITPFTSFTANGNSIANNGNFSLACGTQTVNVTTNTLAGDPPPTGITYTWFKPSGWSGSTTTTGPTASFTSTTGTGGVLKVEAKRDDSNYKVAWTINVTRPTVGSVSISGPSTSIVCSGGTTSLTASAANATSFN